MHLVRRSNGIYHFRMVLSATLRQLLGKVEVHHSLKTKKKRLATTRANQLYWSYKDMKKLQEEDNRLNAFHVEMTGGTKVHIKHDDPEEERKHLKAVIAASEARISKGAVKSNLQDFLPDDLQDLIEQYLDETKGEVTHRTQTDRIRALKMYPSDNIDQNGANEFSKMLRGQELSPATINKYLALLGAFNTWLVNRGHVDRNYFTGLKIKKTAQSHTERDPYLLMKLRYY